MSIYIVPDQVMLLERPLLKIPHEQLRRTLRASQKTIERDLTHVRALADQAKGLRPPRSRHARPVRVSASHLAMDTDMDTDMGMDMSNTEDPDPDPDADADADAEDYSTTPSSSAASAAATLAAISSRKRSISGTAVSTSAPAQTQTYTHTQPPTSSSSLSTSSSSPTDDKLLVADMLARTRALRSKIADSSVQNAANLSSARHRLEFLQALYTLPPNSTITSPQYASWSRTRLAVHIVDFLLRLGYIDIAQTVAHHHNVVSLVDIRFWKDCHRIQHALSSAAGVSEALAWCKDNQSALKKMKNTLEFSLRFQEYVELVRAARRDDAIAYSKKWLVPWSDTHSLQLRQAMTLLAFDPHTTCPPYQAIFAPERWEDLARQFRATVFDLHSLLPVPPFLLSMYTGLSALKTFACYNTKESRNSNNNNTITTINNTNNNNNSEAHDECPTCDEFDLGIIASQKPIDGGVPWSHHVNSSLVCKITGKVMEGENYPLAMPNGRVYSKQALEDMAIASDNGKVRCPRTGDEYNYEELRKVYIL